MFLKALEDRVNKPKTKKVRDTSSPNKKPTCSKCGKVHAGECLVCKGSCFGCCKRSQKVRHFPNLKGKENGSEQACGSNEAPMKNHFYALHSRGEKETYPTL